MRRLLLILALIPVLLVGAIAAAVHFVPASVYKEKIETAAEAALGRDVSLSGDVKLGIFPRITAAVGAASVANPEGFGDAPFASMNQLRAAVKLLPLLTGKVEIDEFVLIDPQVNLIRLADGQVNWTFNSGAPPVDDTSPAPTPTENGNLSAKLGDVRLVNGSVSYDDRQGKTSHSAERLNIVVRLDAVNAPLDVEGDGALDGTDFTLKAHSDNLQSLLDGAPTGVSAKFSTALVSADIDGTASLTDTPSIDIAFNSDIPAIIPLAEKLGVTDIPAAGALGKVKASGRASGPIDNLTVTLTDLNHASALLNADLKGDVQIGKAISVKLTAHANAANLPSLVKMLDMDIPAQSALGNADVSAALAGPLDNLSLSNVVFTHDSDLLKVSFNGAARVAKDITFNGAFKLDAPQLRKLAAAADAQLPEGDVYRSFSLAGDTKGSLTKVTLSNATIKFDDIEGKGNMALDMSGAKPKLTGQITTGLINATPYAAASGASAPSAAAAKKSDKWESTPLDLAPLRLADMELAVTASALKFQAIDIGKSVIDVTLKNGKLTANLSETSLYGGAGNAVLVADGSGATPKIAMRAKLNALNASPFLAAVANFDRLEGVGGFEINLDGQGLSMADIMSSLSGAGTFKFDKGAVRGVNMAQLMRSANEVLTTGAIPSALSAEQETDFTDLSANFSIKNGVAATQDFNFLTPIVQVPGTGELNLGARTLSLSLFPKSGDKQLGIKGFAPPIRISGGWNKLKVGLDTDWLKQQLTNELKGQVGSAITKELGGKTIGGQELGGEIGDVIGKGITGEATGEDVLKGIIGGLSKPKPKPAKEGGAASTTPPASNTETAPTPSPDSAPEAATEKPAAETEPEAAPKADLETELENKLKDLLK